MDTQQNISTVDDLIPPTETVTLTCFKTRSGDPLVVLVEPVREMELLEIVEQLPGLAPQMGAKPERDTIREVKSALEYAAPLIEKGVAIRRADGSMLKPAFSRNPEDIRAGAIPLSWLSVADELLLFHAILRVSGYATAVLEGLSFRHDEPQGRGNGVGDAQAGEADGGAPMASDGLSPGGGAGDAAESPGAAAPGSDGD